MASTFQAAATTVAQYTGSATRASAAPAVAAAPLSAVPVGAVSAGAPVPVPAAPTAVPGPAIGDQRALPGGGLLVFQPTEPVPSAGAPVDAVSAGAPLPSGHPVVLSAAQAVSQGLPQEGAPGQLVRQPNGDYIAYQPVDAQGRVVMSAAEHANLVERAQQHAEAYAVAYEASLLPTPVPPAVESAAAQVTAGVFSALGGDTAQGEDRQELMDTASEVYNQLLFSASARAVIAGMERDIETARKNIRSAAGELELAVANLRVTKKAHEKALERVALAESFAAEKKEAAEQKKGSLSSRVWGLFKRRKARKGTASAAAAVVSAGRHLYGDSMPDWVDDTVEVLQAFNKMSVASAAGGYKKKGKDDEDDSCACAADAGAASAAATAEPGRYPLAGHPVAAVREGVQIPAFAASKIAARLPGAASAAVAAEGGRPPLTGHPIKKAPGGVHIPGHAAEKIIEHAPADIVWSAGEPAPTPEVRVYEEHVSGTDPYTPSSGIVVGIKNARLVSAAGSAEAAGVTFSNVPRPEGYRPKYIATGGRYDLYSAGGQAAQEDTLWEARNPKETAYAHTLLTDTAVSMGSSGSPLVVSAGAEANLLGKELHRGLSKNLTTWMSAGSPVETKLGEFHVGGNKIVDFASAGVGQTLRATRGQTEGAFEVRPDAKFYGTVFSSIRSAAEPILRDNTVAPQVTGGTAALQYTVVVAEPVL